MQTLPMLKLRRNDYLTHSGRVEIEKLVMKSDWTYTITTSYGTKELSEGDVWRYHTNSISRLRKADPDVNYLLNVCVNKESYTGRPHGHGLIRTTMTDEQLRRCFFYDGCDVRPLIRTKLDKWCLYMTNQTLIGYTLHNIRRETYAKRKNKV